MSPPPHFPTFDPIDDVYRLWVQGRQLQAEGRSAAALATLQRAARLHVRLSDGTVLGNVAPPPGDERNWHNWWSLYSGIQCEAAGVQCALYQGRAARLTLQSVERVVPHLTDHRRAFFHMRRGQVWDVLSVTALDEEETLRKRAFGEVETVRRIYGLTGDSETPWDDVAALHSGEMVAQALFYAAQADVLDLVLELTIGEGADLGRARALYERAEELCLRFRETAPQRSAMLDVLRTELHYEGSYLVFLEGAGSEEAIHRAETLLRDRVLRENDPVMTLANRHQAWRGLAVLAALRGDADRCIECADLSLRAAEAEGNVAGQWAAHRIRRLLPNITGAPPEQAAERAANTLGEFVDMTGRELQRRKWLHVMERAAEVVAD